jgi:two-component system, NtrC family, response regulator AtoC
MTAIGALSVADDAQAERALGLRRAASAAGELPWHWLLDSAGLSAVRTMAHRLAAARGAPILIQGERGTGVAELARLIHDCDPITRNGRLRILSSNLLSAADLRRPPSDGTIFMDDVENLRPGAQQWLKDILENRDGVPAAFRVIAGSQHSVDALLGRQDFSQELVHALDVGRLVIPPLRERPADILSLARRFLGHYADWQRKPTLRFSPEAERKLLAHTYPANVRELRNIVERAAALATGEEVSAEAVVVFDQPEPARRRSEPRPNVLATTRQRTAHLPSMIELERDYLVMLIRELKGRRVAISRTMGVSYPTVLKKIARHGLDVRAIVAAAAGASQLID